MCASICVYVRVRVYVYVCACVRVLCRVCALVGVRVGVRWSDDDALLRIFDDGSFFLYEPNFNWGVYALPAYMLMRMRAHD